MNNIIIQKDHKDTMIELKNLISTYCGREITLCKYVLHFCHDNCINIEQTKTIINYIIDNIPKSCDCQQNKIFSQADRNKILDNQELSEYIDSLRVNLCDICFESHNYSNII